MRHCFNGHETEHPGCAGCHHLYHVVRAGRVEGGVLIPPQVNGPEECDMCHEARHQNPMPGCSRCEAVFPELVAMVQKDAAPLRARIMEMKMASWLLGWQATLGGWLLLLAGGSWGDWFTRPDGSHDWLKQAFLVFGIPLIQWGIRREIKRKEKQLPRLSPTGEIVFGPEEESSEEKGLFRP